MNDFAQGDVVIAGNVEVVEDGSDNHKYPLALVIVFKNPQQIRQAISDGVVRFTVFGE
jgi:ATP sulfurylase